MRVASSRLAEWSPRAVTARVAWLDRVREDHESYRAALMWLIERGRSGEAAVLAWRLMFFWMIRGHAAEGLRWYEQILDLPSLSPAAASRALAGAACMRYSQAEFSPAQTAVARAWCSRVSLARRK